MKRVSIICLVVLIGLINSFGQKRVKTICGEAIYVVPSTVSIEEAIKIAIERAKIAALADNFGTLISQSNSTVVKNDNGHSTLDFTSLGGSEVKGEWIEDSETPQTKVFYEKEVLVVKANVCGKAREITHVGVDYLAKILRNGTDIKFESEVFKNGDDFFLYFKSPINGCLAIYLIDSEQRAYCLLPYANNPKGKVTIDHGREYIFFSRKTVTPEEALMVDEYMLTCEKTVENNQVYIIFSPNEFSKANDSRIINDLPRELSYSDFINWLQKIRIRDPEICLEKKMIEIRK